VQVTFKMHIGASIGTSSQQNGAILKRLDANNCLYTAVRGDNDPADREDRRRRQRQPDRHHRVHGQPEHRLLGAEPHRGQRCHPEYFTVAANGPTPMGTPTLTNDLHA
jgi:hypothetical protein